MIMKITNKYKENLRTSSLIRDHRNNKGNKEGCLYTIRYIYIYILVDI